jgi:alpha-glucosidase (family GH31 glycosyl hydrolase)
MVFTSEGNRITFTIDCARELRYYIITGESISDIIRSYHRITGMPSMLPRWTFGYIQSKERYQSGAELEDIVSTFRARNIPVDCIVQDWFSWEDGLWGEKKFDKKRYPDLPSTVKKLHDAHVHFMVSIWPNMSTDSDNYSEFAGAGLLLPNSNLYDVFSEDARDLYWKQTQEEINRIAEQQAKAVERQDRRNRYYGGDSTAKRYKRRPNIYLFRLEDLDNDDVISAVESTPTYKRTREILDSINSQATGDIMPEEQNTEQSEPVQGTIKFF